MINGFAPFLNGNEQIYLIDNMCFCLKNHQMFYAIAKHFNFSIIC